MRLFSGTLFIKIRLNLSLRILLHTIFTFLFHFLYTFVSLRTNTASSCLFSRFNHHLGCLLLLLLIYLCLLWIGNLLTCLALLHRVMLLLLLGKLVPRRFLFRFFRSYYACILLALLNRRCFLLLSFENGVSLGLRYRIFGVIFFVDFMYHRSLIPYKCGLQLLCLL